MLPQLTQNFMADPCQSSVSENTTVVVNFDAVTNGVSGDAVLTAGAGKIDKLIVSALDLTRCSRDSRHPECNCL